LALGLGGRVFPGGASWYKVSTMSLPRVIDTARLQLRDPRPGDAESLFVSCASDPAVLRYLGWRTHASPEETRRHIAFDLHRWLKGSAWIWAITVKQADGRTLPVCGQIELLPLSHPSEQAHHLRLGYLMGRSHWGQGLMSEAVQAVLAAAFARPAVWRVDAWCDVDNAASSRLLARAGMQREGIMRRAIVHPNVSSAPRDVDVWAMVRGAGTVA
jgi:ribosomal-protein-alanine N-acetyltransferase